MKKKSWAVFIGSFLAHVQAMFDDFLTFIFKKCQDVGTKKSQTKKEKECKLYYFGSKFLKILGDIGQSFYETYEEIKQKKQK